MAIKWQNRASHLKNDATWEFPSWLRRNESDWHPWGSIPGLAQWVKGPGIAVSCGVGCRRGSDLALLWLWCRMAAVAPIPPLAWEPPYAAGVSLKRQKINKTKRMNKIIQEACVKWEEVWTLRELCPEREEKKSSTCNITFTCIYPMEYCEYLYMQLSWISHYRKFKDNLSLGSVLTYLKPASIR